MARRFVARRRPINRHWTGFTGGALALSAGTIGVQLATIDHITETLMRMRGSLIGYIDGAQLGGQLCRVAVGVNLVPEGTGSTVLRTPVADADYSWIYWTNFTLGYEEMVTDVVDVPGISSHREVVDNKAMRIMRPDQELQVVFENQTLAMAVSVNLHFSGRLLVQS